MAKSGGGKNAILLIIAVAAIGGAIYSLMSMKTENPQMEQWVYYIDPESVMNDPQTTFQVKVSELKNYAKKPMLDDPEANDRLTAAGICGNCKKWYPLIGHGDQPATCPVCKHTLADYDKEGNPRNPG